MARGWWIPNAKNVSVNHKGADTSTSAPTSQPASSRWVGRQISPGKLSGLGAPNLQFDYTPQKQMESIPNLKKKKKKNLHEKIQEA